MNLDLIKDINNNPHFVQWIDEFHEWCDSNNFDRNLFTLFLHESIESPYGMCLGIRFDITTPDHTKHVIQEVYHLDRTVMSEIVDRFNSMEVEFFKLKVIDKMEWIVNTFGSEVV